MILRRSHWPRWMKGANWSSVRRDFRSQTKLRMKRRRRRSRQWRRRLCLDDNFSDRNIDSGASVWLALVSSHLAWKLSGLFGDPQSRKRTVVVVVVAAREPTIVELW